MPTGKLRRVAVVLAISLVVVLATSLGFALYGEWRVARATERFEATLGTPDLSHLPLAEVQAADQAATRLEAARLLWLDARLALAEGDARRLQTDLQKLDRLAGSLASEPLLITALVALAVDRYYLDLVHQLVTGGADDEALLADVEAALVARDRQAVYLRALAADGSMIPGLSSERLLETRDSGLLQRLRRQLMRPLSRLLVAALLDEYSAIGELVARPWPEIVAASEKRSELGFPRSFAVTLYPNLIDSVGKLKAGQSVGQLAVEAIRHRRALLADGAYPAARETPLLDPYSAQLLLVEPRSDGTLLLEAPGALELWRAHHSVRTRLGEPHFTWVLPATP